VPRSKAPTATSPARWPARTRRARGWTCRPRGGTGPARPNRRPRVALAVAGAQLAPIRQRLRLCSRPRPTYVVGEVTRVHHRSQRIWQDNMAGRLPVFLGSVRAFLSRCSVCPPIHIVVRSTGTVAAAPAVEEKVGVVFVSVGAGRGARRGAWEAAFRRRRPTRRGRGAKVVFGTSGRGPRGGSSRSSAVSDR